METIASRLAGCILEARQADLPRKAREVALSCILDTVGVTLAGINEPCTQILARTPGVGDAPGPALLLGTDRRISMLDAALLNGIASHALDYDDFTGVLGGHHSVAVIPALLALAEARKVDGKAFVKAYAVGVEAEIRIARGVNFHHYDKGWHPTATLGIFGGVAALSTLMGLDREKTATALSLAASLATGLKANFGTMTKPLHIGHANRSALLACLLAEEGFTASGTAFEHHQGFLDVFNGPATYDIDKMFAGWCDPWEIQHDDIGLKQFPCCGSTHPAIMMALKLRAEHGIDAAQIAAIEILPHVRRLRHTNTPVPKTTLEAKFSVQYGVVRALLDGAVRLADFEGDRHLEPAVTALLARTTARPHPQMAEDSADQWGAEVIITLQDGHELSARVDQVVGRGGPNPMRESELWDKFEDCASRALPRELVSPLFERLLTLDKIDDVARMIRMTQTNPLLRVQPKLSEVTFAPASEQDTPETTWVP